MLTFSGALVHSLLLRKMKVDNEKEDEVWFHVGKNDMRFGWIEFGLITGLPMGSAPTKEEIEAKSNNHLVRTDIYYPQNSFLACEIKQKIEKYQAIPISTQALVLSNNPQVLRDERYVGDYEIFQNSHICLIIPSNYL
ncbi:hypothetical protein F8388_027340 [Cannabis sativa]|uniref:Ubiquitin-like domain-containing protein n=1 Tax=Cannabis sativa TaxID=3483 RepID=A0A7J6E7S4_CANSA|nr:hypothetical protein F8388_027340 [Cannabis sativa]